ncbi:MAG TPA: hypothetical protein VF492_03905, partial [Verrucomicrobiae bacterium]
MCSLALCYRAGLGVIQDQQQAITLLRNAA